MDADARCFYISKVRLVVSVVLGGAVTLAAGFSARCGRERRPEIMCLDVIHRDPIVVPL